jgi:hypothetical protein
MKKPLMFGIAAVALAVGILFAGCPTDGGGEESPPSVAYTGVDGSGNIYRLDISGGAKDEAEAGDAYVLTITYPDKSTKTSRGTITAVTGGSMVLKPSSGEVFTVTISGGGIGSITGEIAVEGSDTPVQPPAGISPTKPEKPTEPLEPEEPEEPKEPADPAEPGEPEKPVPDGPPVIKDEQVWEYTWDPNTPDSGALTQYAGSATVETRSDSAEVLGQISDGKLSLNFPDPVSKATSWTTESFTARSDENPLVTRVTVVANDVTFSAGSVNGFIMDELEFDDTEKHRALGFAKNVVREGNNNGTCLYVSYWYVDKALTINGRLEWEKEISAGDDTYSWTETREYDEQWNLTLQPGWNMVQRNFSREGKSKIEGTHRDIEIQITELYTNIPNNDTSDFKWTVNPPRH